MGYWDRRGLPNFYTGPTADGVAPLNSNGPNQGIRSLWASRAGFDGRLADQPGHIDDYWFTYQNDSVYSYENTDPDPYVTAGRPEHSPDCIGDFIGLSQNKWTNLNGECDGNIDAFSFVFWDQTGAKRVNYVPPEQDGETIPDIPSGLRKWTNFRGYESEVFSQLTDFNPNIDSGQGFTFDDLRTEIDAGYPVLLYLQPFDQKFRSLPGMARANPNIHGMLAFGYYITDSGKRYVRYKTSWGSSGDNTLSEWGPNVWQARLPVRGVMGYHPLPKITNITITGDSFLIEWDGPSSVLSDLTTRASSPLHWYVVEKSSAETANQFVPVTQPTVERRATIPICCEDAVLFRVKLLPPSSDAPTG